MARRADSDAGRLHTIGRRASPDLQRLARESKQTAIEGGQVIGLGPHELDVWIWVFEIGLTAVLGLLAAPSLVAALRVTCERPRSSVRRGGA